VGGQAHEEGGTTTEKEQGCVLGKSRKWPHGKWQSEPAQRVHKEKRFAGGRGTSIGTEHETVKEKKRSRISALSHQERWG